GDGAVATTSRMRRRWTSPDGRTAHHIVNPGTGQAAATTTTGATVIARYAWQAEVLAKAAFLDGVTDVDVFGLIESLQAAALICTDRVDLETARWADYVIPSGATPES
ncbi:MAG: FAD:protein FMN transferase, partial [Actinomycetes bacterium]